MNDKNLIVTKSYAFALLIIELYQFLCDEKKEFISKMSIASKEARESKYWLSLLKDSGYIHHQKQKVKILFDEIDSINKILTSIVKSGQENEK